MIFSQTTHDKVVWMEVVDPHLGMESHEGLKCHICFPVEYCTEAMTEGLW